MASSTPNINLTLPVGSENVSRQIINDNNTKIDTAIGAVPPGNDLQSQVTALNTNINGNFATDCNSVETGKIQRFRFNSSTLNTPYKQGITAFSEGWVESYLSNANYGIQTAYATGNDEYTRILNNGTWGNWYSVNKNISKTNLNNSSNITWEITGSNSYYVKTGYVYDLAFDKLSAQNYTNGMLIGTVLNANQLPGRSLFFPVIDEDTGKPINGSVFLSNTTGKLSYYGDALTNRKIRFHGTWIGQTN